MFSACGCVSTGCWLPSRLLMSSCLMFALKWPSSAYPATAIAASSSTMPAEMDR